MVIEPKHELESMIKIYLKIFLFNFVYAVHILNSVYIILEL